MTQLIEMIKKGEHGILRGVGNHRERLEEVDSEDLELSYIYTYTCHLALMANHCRLAKAICAIKCFVHSATATDLCRMHTV